MKGRNVTVVGPAEQRQFIHGDRKQSTGTVPEQKGQGTKQIPQPHTSMAHPDSLPSVFYQPNGWITKPIKMKLPPGCQATWLEDRDGRKSEMILCAEEKDPEDVKDTQYLLLTTNTLVRK